MSIRNEDVHLIGTGSGEVRSTTGEKIGSVGQIYLDDESGEPNWVTVKTGLFGTQESFVPLAQADASGADVIVPYDKETVKGAPRLDAGGSLTPAEEKRLYSYYFSADTVGVGQDTDRGDEAGSSGPGVKERIAEAFDSDRDRDDDDDQRRDVPPAGDRTDDDEVDAGAGGSRLRRYVVTEKVIPVSREEVPVDDPDRP